MANKVYIGRIIPEITEARLLQYFSASGIVEEVLVKKHPCGKFNKFNNKKKTFFFLGELHGYAYIKLGDSNGVNNVMDTTTNF
jgi:hypothetical protein